MADGSVWVSPGMLDTKVIVAPNSPMARANERMVPAMMPGSMSGSVTVRKTQTGWAPSVLAASSSPRSTASIDSCIARTRSGNPITALARAAPVHRNANTIPNVSARKAPIGPRRPNRRSRMNPVTTGGSTSGRNTIPFRIDLPQNLPRDSSMAMSSPGARLATAAQSANRRLNPTAVISSGVKLGTGASVQHREALFLKNSARLRRFELVEETSCVRACRAACQCDGIDDAGVRCVGQYPDLHNARVGDRIRLVNDAERRFASGDQEERGAHVLGLGNATLDQLPNAEHFERRLAVFSSRDRVGIGQCEMTLSKKRGERKPWFYFDLQISSLWSDEDQAVGKEVFTHFRPDEF